MSESTRRRMLEDWRRRSGSCTVVNTTGWRGAPLDMAAATEPIRVPAGLYGVAITDTRIAKSDSDGSLVYRGYVVSELFEKSSFEEVAYLVMEGRLPNRAELDVFTSTLRSRMQVPD